jgi:hypothetical protein
MLRTAIAAKKADAIERITAAAAELGIELPEIGTTIPRDVDAAILQTAEIWQTLAALYEAMAARRAQPAEGTQ